MLKIDIKIKIVKTTAGFELETYKSKDGASALTNWVALLYNCNK